MLRLITSIISIVCIGHTLCSQEIPLLHDDSVHVGHLSNGLKYYIKPTPQENERVLMQLVVKVGSLNETQKELGLAHLLEHMAFVETENFQNALIHFQTKGLQRGIDVNAKTAGDRTYYYLSVPKSDTALIREALQFLKDCSSSIIFDPTKVNKERGVVLAEIEKQYTSDNKIRMEYCIPLSCNKQMSSRIFADERNVISNFKLSTLVKFYKKWYTPGNQSLIVVGNVDSKEIENDIRKFFGTHRKEVNRCLRVPNTTTDCSDSPQLISILEKGKLTLEFKFFHKLPKYQISTSSDVKNFVLKELYNKCIYKKLSRLNFDKGQNIQSLNHYINDKSSPYISFNCSETIVRLRNNSDSIKSSFEMATGLLKFIKQNGFSEEEFESSRDVLAEEIRNKPISQKDIAGLLSNNFIHNDIILDLEQFKLQQLFYLESLKIRDLDSVANRIILPKEFDVVVIGDNPITSTLSKSILNNWIQESPAVSFPRKASITQLPDLHSPNNNLNNYTIHKNESLGVKKIKLKNGITLLLKDNKASNTDKVYFDFFKNKGSFNLQEEELHKLSLAIRASNKSGLSGFSPSDLDYFQTEIGGFITTYIDLYTFGLKGQSSTDQLRSLMNLFRFNFNHLKIDSTSFYQVKNLENNRFINLDTSIQLSDPFYPEDHRLKSLSSNKLNNVTPEDCFKLLKECLSHLSCFYFLLVGNVQEENLNNVVNNLESLVPLQDSSSISSEIFRHEFENSIKYDSVVIANANDSEYSSVKYYLTKQEFSLTYDNWIRAKWLEYTINSYVFDLFRQNGVAYGIHTTTKAYPSSNKLTITLSYRCNQQDLINSMQLIQDVLESLSKGNLSEKEFKNLQNLILEKVIGLCEKDSFWLDFIPMISQMSEDISILENPKDSFSSLSINEINNFIGSFLSDMRTKKVVWKNN